jgi:5S rRNA maturation endonuclease (ribonuclease M5)
MDVKRIKALLRCFGVEHTTTSENWVTCSCPLAPWTHEKGHDSRPSFGININPKGHSIYKCFTCTTEAESLEALVYRYQRRSGRYLREATEILIGDMIPGKRKSEKLEIPKFQRNTEPEKVLEIFPEEALKDYPLLEGRNTERTKEILQWLKGRGISSSTAFRYGLRYWKKFSGFIALPMTTRKGNVSVISLRNINDGTRFRVSAKMAGAPVPKPAKAGVWFGLHLIDMSKPVIFTEGEIDCVRLYELGFRNAVASGGTSVTDAQLSQICATKIIIGLDSDKAGRTAARKLKTRLENKVDIAVINWAKIGCKDPGDVKTRKDLLKVLRPALRHF